MEFKKWITLSIQVVAHVWDLGVLLSAALGKNLLLSLLVHVHMTRSLPEGRGGEQGSVLDVWGHFWCFWSDVTQAQKWGALQSAGVPDSAAICQDTLHGAAVKVFQQNWGGVLLSEIPERGALGVLLSTALGKKGKKEDTSSELWQRLSMEWLGTDRLLKDFILLLLLVSKSAKRANVLVPFCSCCCWLSAGF